MRTSVFGTGYVGCVSAGCLAKLGHQIVAVEPNTTKVEMINRGQTPIIEKGMEELIATAVSSGRLRASADWSAAIAETELAMICVGTPSQDNGSIDLSSIERVCEQIGQGLASKQEYFTVVMRSTVVPGTMLETVVPTLEKCSGKRAGADFGVCINPEFLREGTSIYDFYNPPKTVIGEWDKRSGDQVAELYTGLPGPVVRTEIKVAEMVKYADNSFHALKVCFANEIGNIAQAMGVDSHKLMEIFCLDTKLNLSPYYLKPGFAFGGSCLPKDLRALTYLAKTRDVGVPVLSSILESNEYQIKKVVRKLMSYKRQSLGFLGLSFKEGTDDLRESPIVELVETMIGKGYNVRIHDHNVSLAKLMGANKKYIEKEIPHISELLCSSAEELVAQSDVLVLGSKEQSYAKLLHGMNGSKKIVDLVRFFTPEQHPPSEYYGVCW
ncbi:MAG TPA: UDP-glucose/GDP-mannose dehydrogenase family protein [Candidatus Dormibacteraeota bacterium]|nr:UDP-glucose/GDP-mannose dehydrogenase family protein [Candidatus Dormibacteraeota bacterium]